MYKDKFGRQHGFACPKGPTGTRGNSEDKPTIGLIEWKEKQVLKDKLESEQAQLEAKIKKLS